MYIYNLLGATLTFVLIALFGGCLEFPVLPDCSTATNIAIKDIEGELSRTDAKNSYNDESWITSGNRMFKVLNIVEDAHFASTFMDVAEYFGRKRKEVLQAIDHSVTVPYDYLYIHSINDIAKIESLKFEDQAQETKNFLITIEKTAALYQRVYEELKRDQRNERYKKSPIFSSSNTSYFIYNEAKDPSKALGKLKALARSAETEHAYVKMIVRSTELKATLSSHFELLKTLEGVPGVLHLDGCVYNYLKPYTFDLKGSSENLKTLDLNKTTVVLVADHREHITQFAAKTSDCDLLVDVAGQYIQVLKEIHSKGIIHLNITPNAMLVKDGKAYLDCFGSAVRKTTHNEPAKRYFYTAHEMLKLKYSETNAVWFPSHEASYNNKVDVYALGISLARVMAASLTLSKNRHNRLVERLCGTNRLYKVLQAMTVNYVPNRPDIDQLAELKVNVGSPDPEFGLYTLMKLNLEEWNKIGEISPKEAEVKFGADPNTPIFDAVFASADELIILYDRLRRRYESNNGGVEPLQPAYSPEIDKKYEPPLPKTPKQDSKKPDIFVDSPKQRHGKPSDLADRQANTPINPQQVNNEQADNNRREPSKVVRSVPDHYTPVSRSNDSLIKLDNADFSQFEEFIVLANRAQRVKIDAIHALINETDGGLIAKKKAVHKKKQEYMYNEQLF